MPMPNGSPLNRANRGSRGSRPTSLWTILVVDDDADTRSAIGEVLAAEGFTMAFASNGREALDALENGPLPDLILLDWRMPVMDGEEFLARFDTQAERVAIPLIIFTALRLHGPTGHRRTIRKPIDLEELVSTVSAVMADVNAR
jgi:CheY-like chemotaxis protein